MKGDPSKEHPWQHHYYTQKWRRMSRRINDGKLGKCPPECPPDCQYRVGKECRMYRGSVGGWMETEKGFTNKVAYKGKTCPFLVDYEAMAEAEIRRMGNAA